MPELKVHDPSVVSVHRKTGQKGYWIVHKDGTEEFVEDKPMTNPRRSTKEIDKSISDTLKLISETKDPELKKKLKESYKYLDEQREMMLKENPRKKERELRKPERPGNYQKIMKEIDDRGATEYKFRMMPPGKFDEQSFRRKVITTGVSIVFGCPKGEFSHLFKRCKNGMAVQALRLAKSVFKTKKDAAKWIASHTMTKY